eukprot:s2252_g3.t1
MQKAWADNKSAKAISVSSDQDSYFAFAMAKWVYDFGDGKADGRAEMKNLLGGKGANLAEMASIGLPHRDSL